MSGDDVTKAWTSRGACGAAWRTLRDQPRQGIASGIPGLSGIPEARKSSICLSQAAGSCQERAHHGQSDAPLHRYGSKNNDDLCHPGYRCDDYTNYLPARYSTSVRLRSRTGREKPRNCSTDSLGTRDVGARWDPYGSLIAAESRLDKWQSSVDEVTRFFDILQAVLTRWKALPRRYARFYHLKPRCVLLTQCFECTSFRRADLRETQNILPSISSCFVWRRPLPRANPLTCYAKLRPSLPRISLAQLPSCCCPTSATPTGNCDLVPRSSCPVHASTLSERAPLLSPTRLVHLDISIMLSLSLISHQKPNSQNTRSDELDLLDESCCRLCKGPCNIYWPETPYQAKHPLRQLQMIALYGSQPVNPP